MEVFNSDWNIQKNASFIVYFTKKLLSFMKILGNKLVDSEYKIGFYMQLTRRMFWHFFGWNFEKNHSAFLLGLRKTVRTTAFYSTLHTEHLPMSHWGSSFFSSCSNLKCHYIFSWFCIFIVTVSTNNLSIDYWCSIFVYVFI